MNSLPKPAMNGEKDLQKVRHCTWNNLSFLHHRGWGTFISLTFLSVVVFAYRRKVHKARTFFTPTTHEIRGMRVV